ncbi:MAG: aconitase/3-isopropylmalate dehydratase large subunit family protein [Chloroflexota bacterium]
MTITEKILARHAGKRAVRPGDLVECRMDVAVMVELFFAGMRQPKKVWDPDRVWLFIDHAVPAPTVGEANDVLAMRRMAERAGIKNLVDVGRQGISHVVLAERGALLPGTLLANVDSHTAAVGALNCAGRGLGNPDMLHVLCTGKTWFPVGPTVRFIVKGKMPVAVLPRDIIHYVAGEYGDFANRNLEWYGPVVEEMDIAGRFTIATMSVEISAEFALFPCDKKTLDYLDGRAREPFEPAAADTDARYEATYEVDVTGLEPQVVLPDKVPHNVKPVSALKGTRIEQAFLGSCASGRLEDIKVAADILKGREVAPGVRFIVTPGSQAVYLEALEAGYITTLTRAGAVVTNATCGACYGGSMGLLGDGETCISASTRNFRGRMGSPSSRVFLGSPAVVAASALKGEIADPRDYWG